MKFLTKGRLSILLIVLVLFVDQMIKIAVKTHMGLYEKFSVCGDWFYILFTENNGMAFGMELFGKFFLTSFRLAAVVAIGYYIYKVIQRGQKTGYVICLSLIWAGAMGNIIDSLAYGLLFTESLPYQVSQIVPWGEGYAPFLYGKVVDMFYFPLIDTTWPQWLPVVGGEHFIFFSPIFNFADASISCGIISLLLFYRHSLNSFFAEKEEMSSEKISKL